MKRRQLSLRGQLVAVAFTTTLPAAALAQPVIDRFHIAVDGPPCSDAPRAGGPRP